MQVANGSDPLREQIPHPEGSPPDELHRPVIVTLIAIGLLCLSSLGLTLSQLGGALSVARSVDAAAATAAAAQYQGTVDGTPSLLNGLDRVPSLPTATYSYQAQRLPGLGCDAGGADWMTRNGNITCLRSSTLLSQPQQIDPSDQVPNPTLSYIELLRLPESGGFSANESASVIITGLTSASCAGIWFGRSLPDSGYAFLICGGSVDEAFVVRVSSNSYSHVYQNLYSFRARTFERVTMTAAVYENDLIFRLANDQTGDSLVAAYTDTAPLLGASDVALVLDPRSSDSAVQFQSFVYSTYP